MQSPHLIRLKKQLKKVPIIASTYRTVRWSRLIKQFTRNPRKNLNNYIALETKGTVISGPFVGMRLEKNSSWGDGDISPKLLGTYEQELHYIFHEIYNKKYDAVVDIGCADGFYAVGLARFFKDTPVYAYDIDQKARKSTLYAAQVNNISELISIGCEFNALELQHLAKQKPRLFIMSDCEGYERELFGDKEVIPHLLNADILIECHEDKAPNCTEEIRAMLCSSHKIETIIASGRNPNVFDFLAVLGDADRWQAINENRSYRMCWLWCKAYSL